MLHTSQRESKPLWRSIKLNKFIASKRYFVNRPHKQFRSIAYLLIVSWKFRPMAESANSTKDGLEPFRLRGAPRCAFRGQFPTCGKADGLHRLKKPKVVRAQGSTKAGVNKLIILIKRAELIFALPHFFPHFTLTPQAFQVVILSTYHDKMTSTLDKRIIIFYH
jgi:hypothetical protein